jgi:proton-coupled amino acid transporter
MLSVLTPVLTLVGMVGSGVLFLPKAYEQGGLIASNVAMFVIGIMALYCIKLLVEIRESDAAPAGSPLFGDLAELMLGKAGRRAVDVSIVLSQLGFCCCYLIFVSDNIRQSLMLLSNCTTNLPGWAMILAQAAIYVPLSWVRRINYFGVTSAFSNILTAAGLLYIFSVSVSMEATDRVVKNFNWASFPLFIGTGVYTFTGIGLVVPIYNSMKVELRPRFMPMATATFAGIMVLVCTFASLVYMSLGEKVTTVITKELPHDTLDAGTVATQLAYSLALVLSYPLQLFPCISILEQYFVPYSSKDNPAVKWYKNGFRTALVFLTVAISVECSTNLNAFVSLIGGLCCVPLAFIYPALMHAQVAKERWQIAVDWALISVGLVLMVYCTYTAIANWKDIADDNTCPLKAVQ